MNKNCFALKNRDCKALTKTLCVTDSCPFYKTSEQFAMDRRTAMAHLTSLDISAQDYIAEKYYEGKYVWMEGERS